MGSRDRDQTAPHQPQLSSLVVRLSDSSGGGGGGGDVNGGSDYESGEVGREGPHYPRAERFGGGTALNVAWYKNLGLEEGYRIRAGSSSPVRRRSPDHRYNSEFDHSGGMPRDRDFSGERDPGRYRNHSPPYGRGRGGSRSFGRGLDRLGFGSPGSFRSEGLRSNPNVRPREGDWVCPDPLCGNLNFARREQCNNCNRFRDGPGGSPRRGYAGPSRPRRFSGPPIDHSPGRTMNGYRSPPRGWARDGPREFGGGALSQRRHGGRFPDQNMQRDRFDYPEEDDYTERNKFERPDWGHRDRGRDSFFGNERKGYGRRLSPPPPPPPPMLRPRARWDRDIRARSRSPVRGGPPPPPKDYRRDVYMERGRGGRHGFRRDRFDEPY